MHRLLYSIDPQTMRGRVGQGSGALQFLTRQLEAIQLDIEACEMQMLDCGSDVDTLLALTRVRVKYEATAFQLQFEIKALR